MFEFLFLFSLLAAALSQLLPDPHENDPESGQDERSSRVIKRNPAQSRHDAASSCRGLEEKKHRRPCRLPKSNIERTFDRFANSR